jgi:KUP system potassium uptake protein
MITPAMSVLSAVEGLSVINKGFEPVVVPLTLAILITLFVFQYKGTAGVASLFAPVTMVWFITLGVMGFIHIFDDLQIFLALNPWYGFRMLVEQPGLALLVFGGVFLAVTGGEALYADMGHFGRGPSASPGPRWCCPASSSTTWARAPSSFPIRKRSRTPLPHGAGLGPHPIVILATMVTVIASQAVITGAFSIAQQAMSLGLLPRMNITHTNEEEQGQIYVGQINWLILFGVILLVLVFQSSSNLASAYGVAVNTSMIVDSILGIIFFWKARTLPRWFAIPALIVILRHRDRVRRRQCPEDPAWRLHAGADGLHHHPAHGHVAARPRPARQEAGKGIDRTGRPAAIPRTPFTHARRRGRRLHADRYPLRPLGPHAQSQAQPRAA